MLLLIMYACEESIKKWEGQENKQLYNEDNFNLDHKIDLGWMDEGSWNKWLPINTAIAEQTNK